MGAPKGSVPWNKGRKCPEISASLMGHSVSTQTRRKIGKANSGGHPKTSDEKHWNWKGDKVGYFALHQWISKKLGRPNKCENCGTTSRPKYEWANISGEYRRDLSDWARLCYLCHDLIDNSGLFARTPEEV